MKKQIRKTTETKQVQKNQKGNNLRNALASGIVGFVLGLGLFGFSSMQQNNAAEAPVEVASVLGDTTERGLDTSAVAVDVIKEVESEPQIVTRTVTNTVQVPGETQIVTVPGETKIVEVPGETKIVEVPGETKVVTNTVYVDKEVAHVYEVTNTVNNGNGTYNVTFTCKECGDSYVLTIGDEVEDHKHVFEVVSHKDATCTEKGVDVYACECGATYAEEIAALGHDYVKDETTYVEPTEASEGKEADEVCTRCGDVVTGATIAKLVEEHSHAYVETERVDATCCEDGYVVYTCNCNDSYSEVLPALGHDYVKDETTYVEPTEASEGKEADEVCTRCGDVVTGNVIEKLPQEVHESHKDETICTFNEYGYGFYNDLHTGEEVCTTRGAYRQYLADNYPECNICEDETSIWAE